MYDSSAINSAVQCQYKLLMLDALLVTNMIQSLDLVSFRYKYICYVGSHYDTKLSIYRNPICP